MGEGSHQISIVLNGQPRQLPAGLTVAALLEELAIKPERVAVELNRQILKREHWATTVLQSGDQVEIVHFVGGGR